MYILLDCLEVARFMFQCSEYRLPLSGLGCAFLRIVRMRRACALQTNIQEFLQVVGRFMNSTAMRPQWPDGSVLILETQVCRVGACCLGGWGFISIGQRARVHGARPEMFLVARAPLWVPPISAEFPR